MDYSKLSDDDKQGLAGLCRIEIKRWKCAAESNPNMRYMVELMEVALASLTAEGGWIKCSDRMPEKGQLCLIYILGEGFYIEHYDTPHFSNPHTCDITHWQPLPAPPEE